MYRRKLKYTIYFALLFCLVLTSLKLTSCYAKSAEEYYLAGNKFYEDKDYDKAIESYKKSLSENVKLLGAFNNLANIYFYQKKDYIKTEQICLEGLSYYPFEDLLISITMYIDFKLGRLEKGLSKYVALSQQNLPYAVTFNIEEVKSLMRKKGYSKEEIIQTFNNLLQINPEDQMILYEVAEYLKDNRKYQEALEKYIKVLDLNPRMKMAYGGMGSCYYNLGNSKKALECFTKAKEAGYFVPDEFFEKLERELAE